MSARVVIAGGSGQIGRHLRRHHEAQGAEVVVLSRRPSAPGEVEWDGRSLGAWAEQVDGAKLVVNLAGRTVDCRYNARNRREIIDSRVDSTRVIGEAIAAARRPPPLWMNASTATIYVDSRDTPQLESTGRIWRGDEAGVEETWLFSVDVAKRWEAALSQAETPHTRKVALRASMVMDWEPGGVFAVLSRLVRFGLGGRQGDGGQWMAWIHIDDFLRALDFIESTKHLEGAINVCGPRPELNRDFMAKLRAAWGRRWGLPADPWMIRLGTWMLRTEPELVLKSRYVLPERLEEAGFVFSQPDWAEAARDLVARARGA